LEYGAEIHLGPLELVLGKVHETVSALDKSLKNFKHWTPFISRTLCGEGTSAGAGSFLIDIGSPGQGKIWNVISVCLFANTADYSPVANLTGSTVYIGTAEDFTNSAEVLVPSLGTTTVPGLQTFGHETIWQWPGEHLLFNSVVSGASAGFAVARVLEYAIDDVVPKLI
jgi:hypothetical protein